MNISKKTGIHALLVCLSITTNLKSVWITEILNASSGPIGVKIIDTEQWKRDVVYVNPEGDLVKTSGSQDVWIKSGDSAKIENTPMPWVGKTNKGEDKKIVICAVKDISFIDTCSGEGLKARVELNDYYGEIVRKVFTSQNKAGKWVTVLHEPQTPIHKNHSKDEVLAIVVEDGKAVNEPIRVSIVSPSAIPAFRDKFKVIAKYEPKVPTPVAKPAPTKEPLVKEPVEEPKKAEPVKAPLVTSAPSKPQPQTPSQAQTNKPIELNLGGL